MYDVLSISHNEQVILNVLYVYIKISGLVGYSWMGALVRTSSPHHSVDARSIEPVCSGSSLRQPASSGVELQHERRCSRNWIPQKQVRGLLLSRLSPVCARAHGRGSERGHGRIRVQNIKYSAVWHPLKLCSTRSKVAESLDRYRCAGQRQRNEYSTLQPIVHSTAYSTLYSLCLHCW